MIPGPHKPLSEALLQTLLWRNGFLFSSDNIRATVSDLFCSKLLVELLLPLVSLENVLVAHEMKKKSERENERKGQWPKGFCPRIYSKLEFMHMFCGGILVFTEKGLLAKQHYQTPQNMTVIIKNLYISPYNLVLDCLGKTDLKPFFQ